MADPRNSSGQCSRRRTKRTSRKPNEVRSRRTERDIWIMEALAKMQFLTTGQIARLLFDGSRSPTRRRLRKLFDAGLVRVWVRSLNLDNVYAVTPQGRKLLEEETEA
jgi:hypothetical protein